MTNLSYLWSLKEKGGREVLWLLDKQTKSNAHKITPNQNHLETAGYKAKISDDGTVGGGAGAAETTRVND